MQHESFRSTEKVRVGVFMGGRSIEHEVSFNSGRTVCDHLDISQYEVIPLFQTQNGLLYKLPWYFLHRGKTTDFVHRLAQEAEQIAWDALPEVIDFMYIAVHGRYAEDGTLQGFLEVLGIPYLGSGIFSSALRMDKIKQKDVLSMHGIKTPLFCVLENDQIPADIACINDVVQKMQEHSVAFPCVVKPHNEGSSLGVSVAFNQEQLFAAIRRAVMIDVRDKKKVLIEEKIEGMEFSSIILADPKNGAFIPLPPTEIVPIDGISFFDYEQKYMPGKSIKHTPPRCTPEQIEKIQQTCLVVMHALGIRTIARIDGFLTPAGDVVIIDPNSLSGMDPASFFFRAAAEVGMSHTAIINHLIKAELYARAQDLSLHMLCQEESKTMDNHTQKMRIAVLMGGASNEKEISLESGRNVVYKLSPEKYSVVPLFVSDDMHLYSLSQSLLVRNSTKEIKQLLSDDMRVLWSDLQGLFDFIFIALHGGLGENGAVQGTLEMMDIPYNGSPVFASALCMNKYKTAQLLQYHGCDVPSQFLITKRDWNEKKSYVINQIASKMSYPLVVKPYDDGCSVFVAKIFDEQMLVNHVQEIFDAHKDAVLVEECIQGMELTVGVFGNKTPKALPPSQTVAASDILSIQEKFLPGAGENQTPAPLSSEAILFVQQEVERAYKIAGCKGYARIDCFYQSADKSVTGKERLIILEINTLPALTPATCLFHQAAEIGIKPMEWIDLIVQLGLEEHGHKKQTMQAVSVDQKNIG